MVEPLLFDYADDNTNYLQCIYGYVPIEIVYHIINKHGGIDVEKTFKEI